jgi:hypothetical protein
MGLFQSSHRLDRSAGELLARLQRGRPECINSMEFPMRRSVALQLYQGNGLPSRDYDHLLVRFDELGI